MGFRLYYINEKVVLKSEPDPPLIFVVLFVAFIHSNLHIKAIKHFHFLEGGDDCILWLTFAEQKMYNINLMKGKICSNLLGTLERCFFLWSTRQRRFGLGMILKISFGQSLRIKLALIS
jgi:hypothetical protein